MTVSNQTSKNVFVGDGATLVFAYTFRIFADADLLVTIQDTSVTPQTEITLVLTTDYTVSGAGDQSGGNVTLLLTGQLSSAPSATDNITIQRNLPIIQPTDYVENDPFPAESHEKELDRGAFIDQQLKEVADRSLQLSVNITGVDITLPTPLANAPIGWNPAADGLTNNPSLTNLSQIDVAATADFIGAASGDGVLRTGTGLSYTDGGNFVTLAVDATYANITANDGATDITAAEFETLTDGSNADSLHTHATITNDQVKVDAAATRDFIGATASDGVIRAGSSIAVADGGNFITLTVSEANVDHDALSNFVANEHIDHTTVTLTAGVGLSGGGDISANRTFTLDLNELGNETAIAAGDFIAMVDITDSGSQKITFSDFEGDLNHDNLLGFVANEHIDHSTVNITTTVNTSGLAGGGDLTSSRSLVVDIANTTAGTVASLDEVLIADVDDSDNLKRVTAQSIADLAGAAATTFVSLTDTPANFTSDGLKMLRVNTGETALEFFLISDTAAATVATGDLVMVSDINDSNILKKVTAQSIADLGGVPIEVEDEAVSLTTNVTKFNFAGAGVTATEPLADEILVTIPGGAGASFTQSFTNASLTASILTVTHSLGSQYVVVGVFDNNDKMVIPDEITATSTTVTTIDFTSFGTLAGTWNVRVVG